VLDSDSISDVASETAALRQVAWAHGIWISGESFAEVTSAPRQFGPETVLFLAGLLTGREPPLRYVTRLAASAAGRNSTPGYPPCGSAPRDASPGLAWRLLLKSIFDNLVVSTSQLILSLELFGAHQPEA